MKKLLLACFLVAGLAGRAQYDETSSGAFRLGAGYVYDFPGLTGWGVYGEYTVPMTDWLEGGIGVKRIQASGYPRTKSISEYTKATTLDFNLLFVPYKDAQQAFKIGGGYSFSFYRVQRSYPVYGSTETAAALKEPSWQVKNAKGRRDGFALIGEYEYSFNSNISAGLRAALTKAYDNVFMGGPFVAVRF